jgi:gliding motility-associated-like protein
MQYDSSIPPSQCAATTCGQNLLQATYTQPGTYKLSVTYPSNATGADDIIITVDPYGPPTFDIYTCAGDQVSINITDKSYDKYNIDFNNDGTVDKTIPSGNNQTANFTYGAAGNYNISVQGQKVSAAPNCTPKVQSFTALNALPIPILKSLSAIDASTLKLAFSHQINIEYKGEIAFNNASNFQVYQTLYAVDTMIAANLGVDANYYCFRLSSFDPCANTNVYSPPICSQKFSLALVSSSDQLAWQTSSTGINSINVNRNNSLLTTLPATSTSYNDNAVVCQTKYCYQLIGNYASGVTSTSLTKCGVAFNSTPPTPITNTSAVVNDSQVDLSWVQDPAFTTPTYNVFRAAIGESFAIKDVSTSAKYTDTDYGTGGYCYMINYTDNCNNKSGNGLVSCPIRLLAGLDHLNNVSLNWSDYKGWNQGVKTYTLQKYFQPGQAPQTIYVGPDSTFSDSQQDQVNQVVYYKVTATANENGIAASVSNEVKVIKHISLSYPTAFNPESKVGANRAFFVKGFYVSSMKLQVFDRWGSLVFVSDKDETWDGKKDGTAMPDATYVWTADGMDFIGKSFSRTGVVVLIRK